MFKILKTYFLVPWIGLSILFLIKASFGNNVNLLSEDIITGLIFAVGLTLFVGTIYFFLDTGYNGLICATLFGQTVPGILV
tara:strand:+ start:443 stop:685 length:243 start_codon:yes stop_codon:yes gene_type:complete